MMLLLSIAPVAQKIVSHFHNEGMWLQVGTPYYLSPELCENRPYNMQSDMWALVCVCAPAGLAR
jgi:serine/threonine protein kinase